MLRLFFFLVTLGVHALRVLFRTRRRSSSRTSRYGSKWPRCSKERARPVLDDVDRCPSRKLVQRAGAGSPRQTGYLGDFCQMTYQPAGLLIRLRRCASSCIATLCACWRALNTSQNPAHPGMSFSGNRLNGSKIVPLYGNPAEQAAASHAAQSDDQDPIVMGISTAPGTG